MSDLPARIGRYHVQRRLGEGGMGVLYLASDPVLGRAVALKLLRVDGDEVRRRFVREAQSAASLQHPNIVTVYDVGDHEGQLFIAMEYIDGDTLAALIHDRVPFSPLRKLDILDEIADGLGFAHLRGIVHRDIKPANLMISRSGLAKILDFGIARVNTLDSGEITGATMLGTPAYMAPELLEGAEADQRADIYALGLVMYELFAGQRAFAAPTTDQVLEQVLAAKATPLETLRPDLDPALGRIVSRAMARRPEDRYPDLQSLRKDLARARRTAMLEHDDETIVASASAPTPSAAPSSTPAVPRLVPVDPDATVVAPLPTIAPTPVPAAPPVTPPAAPPPVAPAAAPPLGGPPIAAAAVPQEVPPEGPRLEAAVAADQAPPSTPVPPPPPAIPSDSGPVPVALPSPPPPLPAVASARAEADTPQQVPAPQSGPVPVALPSDDASPRRTSPPRAAVPPVAAPLSPSSSASPGVPVQEPASGPATSQAASTPGAGPTLAPPIAARPGLPVALILGGLFVLLGGFVLAAFFVLRSLGLFSFGASDVPDAVVADESITRPSTDEPVQTTEQARQQTESPGLADVELGSSTTDAQATPTTADADAITTQSGTGTDTTRDQPVQQQDTRVAPPVPTRTAEARPERPRPTPTPARQLPTPVTEVRRETPVPTPPPARQEAPVAPPVSVPRDAAIGLVRGYVAARNTAHASGIRRVWPSVDDAHIRRVTSSFSSPLTLSSCDVDADGPTRAVATCHLTQPGTTGAYANGQPLTIRRTLVFDLARRGSEWVIAGLRE